ncbi:hypothetical protein QFZ53_002279 [Microbacterium natoriense]|uniref:Uncharacterized protein n=1 Tax=Microbacterium natoriense TaxID=284570 RepID=A0AAW8EXV8_9MICO|nr:hypothetical protein [Microbacterium natoriense]MDQ0648083.1 hypothetical protein [Microbacterium natoriense]
MAMSFEEFQGSLLNADQRAAMGIHLTDAEAHAVYAEAATAQAWYSYWLSTQPASAPPAEYVIAPAPYPGAAVDQPTVPISDPYAAQPTGFPTATTPYPDFASSMASAPPKKKHTALWVILSILLVLILAAIGTVVFAFATARHWTAIDVPEHPETFHTEEYDTGLYDVTMDEINPCWVNQDWTDCTNLYVASYNAACSGVSLTDSGSAVCTDYADMIEQMKAQDGEGYYVETLGGYGGLHQTAERATREVSNNDYTPAETHEAVCYLGFIGECGTSTRTTTG